jgi:hypothetical protein
MGILMVNYGYGWLTVSDFIKLSKLSQTYEIMRGQCCSYLRSSFTSTSQVHSYETRGPAMIFLSR